MPKLLRCLFTLVLLVSTVGQPVKAGSGDSFFREPYQVVLQSNYNNFSPAIAYDPIHDQYLVVWEAGILVGGSTNLQIFGRLLKGNGFVASNPFVIANGPSSFTSAPVDRKNPSVAFDLVRQRYLVTYSIDIFGNNNDWDIYGTYVPYDGPHPGNPLSEFPIAASNNNEFNPKVAYASVSDKFMIVWEVDPASAPSFISGTILSGTGSFTPFLVSQGSQPRYSPDLAYNQARDSFLIVWDVAMGSPTFKDVYGDDFSAEGNEWVFGKFSIANSANNEEMAAVAACYKADQYLVVWGQDIWRGDHGDWDIWGRYLSGDLQTIYDAKLIMGTTLPQVNPDLTCNWQGTRYFLAWQDMYADPYPYYGIWAMWLETDQTNSLAWDVIDPGTTQNRTNVGVSAGKTSYIAAWEHGNGITGWQDIWSQTFIPAVVFLPTIRR